LYVLFYVPDDLCGVDTKPVVLGCHVD